MALPIFAITLFVSAFLLFLVQPMIGKLILPKLGGTPQVWNTCMVFFQSVLLLGYAYTHTVSTKLKLRQQLMLHCALLVIPIGLILWHPFYATVHEWSPPAGSNPIPQTLLLLAMVVGVPFFVVSTSAPLLQRWFAYSGDPAAKDPYFLYGASNLGSLLSLLFYPAVIEPWTVLPSQSDIWLGGYVVLAGLIAYCAFKIYNLAPPDAVLAAEAAAAASAPPVAPKVEAPAPAPMPAPAVESSTALKPGPGPGGGRSSQRKKGMKHVPGKPDEEKSIAKPLPAPVIATGATAEMTWWRRVRWVLLAAVPSSLMLGVTSFISTDLSPFPLVWVVPLALYLLSFILVFMKVWTGRRFQIFSSHYTLHDMTLYVLQPLGIIVLCFIILSHKFDPFSVTSMVMFGFFATALACHGELAHDRPATKHLTEYFLLMSFGGFIGGFFNGIIAPIVFQTGVWEFHVAIVIACLIRPQYVPSGWFDEIVLQAFPGLQTWARNQGDEMAKSMGRPAPRSTYLFNVFLDVVFGVFILSISWWLAANFTGETAVKIAKFLQFPMETEYQQDKWTKIVFNVFVFFLPMVFCFFFAGRPLRFGLAITGLLLGNLYFAGGEDTSDTAAVRTLEARRTYFGVLRVQLSKGLSRGDFMRDPQEIKQLTKKPLEEDGKFYAPPYPYTFLMHGTTYHGRNYKRDSGDKYQENRVDLSRLATTYYHRYGPVGFVMERHNWWASGAMLRHPDDPEDPKDPKGPKRLLAPSKMPAAADKFLPGRQNDFTADVRMPVSLIGFMGGSFGMEPLSVLVGSQSEPPIATIGLGTGTMVSYARPYGHMTYYEIDDVIRHFSLPEDGGEARFTYLQNAIRRGVNLEVIMGDARQSLQPDREKYNKLNTFLFQGDFSGSDSVMEKILAKEPYPYAEIPYNSAADKQLKSFAPNRDHYYKAINVDAFSSDAIPVHLVTKQAIEIYMSKMTEDGVLCVHTSNRHMDLVRPVARIALELDEIGQKATPPYRVGCRVGKDGDKGRYMGHFSSEYVMIYKGDFFTKYVDRLAAKKKEFIKNYLDAAKKGDKGLVEAEADGVLMMRPETAESMAGPAPPGWQILNSVVRWYDPYKDQEEPRYGRWHKAVTLQDSLWTDDYTYILGVLR